MGNGVDKKLNTEEMITFCSQMALILQAGISPFEGISMMMEDQKNDLVVIVAGYKDEMEFFIDSNPGLKSRFTSYIDFPDYTPEEMQQMFELRAASEMFIISESAKAK